MTIEKTLIEDGWEIECESPFEIRHAQTNSFVSGNYAVHIIYHEIINKNKFHRIILANDAHTAGLIDDQKLLDVMKEELPTQ